MREMTRTAQREKVMQSLYNLFFSLDYKIDYDATTLINDIFQVDDFSLIPLYAQKLYVTSLDNYDEIKKIVSSNLNNWQFERISPLSRAILFLAIAEGKYLKETPKAIVINEAIKLAKVYLTQADYKFVNSLLDKVIENYECRSK